MTTENNHQGTKENMSTRIKPIEYMRINQNEDTVVIPVIALKQAAQLNEHFSEWEISINRTSLFRSNREIVIMSNGNMILLTSEELKGICEKC